MNSVCATVWLQATGLSRSFQLLEGLATAYELAKYAVSTKSSLEITIIEKDNRIGGRVKTVGMDICQIQSKFVGKKTIKLSIF